MSAYLDQLREKMYTKFQTIHWGHHPCGHGSVFENTEVTRELLSNIAKKYDIKTVSDAGAGDLSWIDSVKWDVEYTPYDIRKWHSRVNQVDITKDVLPKTDLIMCRHVLNHLENQLQAEAIDRFVESGSKYLFLTYTKPNCYGRVWETPLEECTQVFPGGKVWKFGLWQINS